MRRLPTRWAVRTIASCAQPARECGDPRAHRSLITTGLDLRRAGVCRWSGPVDRNRRPVPRSTSPMTKGYRGRLPRRITRREIAQPEQTSRRVSDQLGTRARAEERLAVVVASMAAAATSGGLHRRTGRTNDSLGAPVDDRSNRAGSSAIGRLRGTQWWVRPCHEWSEEGSPRIRSDISQDNIAPRQCPCRTAASVYV